MRHGTRELRKRKSKKGAREKYGEGRGRKKRRVVDGESSVRKFVRNASIVGG